MPRADNITKSTDRKIHSAFAMLCRWYTYIMRTKYARMKDAVMHSQWTIALNALDVVCIMELFYVGGVWPELCLYSGHVFSMVVVGPVAARKCRGKIRFSHTHTHTLIYKPRNLQLIWRYRSVLQGSRGRKPTCFR